MTDEAVHVNDLPVFSPRLDELMANMLAGEAPNVGRFCGYCYTPLGRKADVCPHCHRTTSEYEAVAKIPAAVDLRNVRRFIYFLRRSTATISPRELRQ